jgi:hypothetical protein
MKRRYPTMPKAERQAFVALVVPAVRMCWGQIGHEVEALSDECGERLTNPAAIEGCIDANRLIDLGGKQGKQADAAVTVACDKYGFPAVMRLLQRHVSLV